MHGGGCSGRGIALILSLAGFYTWLGREEARLRANLHRTRAPAARPLPPKSLSVDDAVQLAVYSK
jgi:site-specific recombinase XerC